MDSVAEGSSARLRVVPKDYDGAAAAPSTARYRVDDVATGGEVRAWTALSAATQMDILLDSTDTAVVTAGAGREQRRVTVEASYGVSDLVRSTFHFEVRHLAGA